MGVQGKFKIDQGGVKFLTLCASIVLSAPNAYAANSDVEFHSSPTVAGETCIIEVTSGGTLGLSTDYLVLSSKEVGGAGGTAIVTSRKRNRGSSPGPRFAVSFEAPTGFTTSPVGGDTGVNFRTRFSGTSISNGVSFNERNGTNARRLPRRGTTVTGITGHLIATRTGSVYPAGSYTAQAVLRCE